VSWKEFLAPFEERVRQAAAQNANLSGVYQFVITGEGGGSFYADFQNGQVNLAEGQHANPGVTVECSLDTVKGLMNRSINPMMAFMTGKVKIKGDMGLAMRLQTLLG
jgi:putative sterol carrier protein